MRNRAGGPGIQKAHGNPAHLDEKAEAYSSSRPAQFAGTRADRQQGRAAQAVPDAPLKRAPPVWEGAPIGIIPDT